MPVFRRGKRVFTCFLPHFLHVYSSGSPAQGGVLLLTMKIFPHQLIESTKSPTGSPGAHLPGDCRSATQTTLTTPLPWVTVSVITSESKHPCQVETNTNPLWRANFTTCLRKISSLKLRAAQVYSKQRKHMTMKEFQQEQQTTKIIPAKTLGIRTNKNQRHNIKLRD